jgi:hypothetical protein
MSLLAAKTRPRHKARFTNTCVRVLDLPYPWNSSLSDWLPGRPPIFQGLLVSTQMLNLRQKGGSGNSREDSHIHL